MMSLWHENAFCITGPIVRGIQWSPVDSPHKGPVMQSLIHNKHVYLCWPIDIISMCWIRDHTSTLVISPDSQWIKDDCFNGTRWSQQISLSGQYVTDLCKPFHDDIVRWKCIPHYWPYYEGNPLVTGGFPSQRASNAELDTWIHCDMDIYSALLTPLLGESTIHRWIPLTKGQ